MTPIVTLKVRNKITHRNELEQRTLFPGYVFCRYGSRDDRSRIARNVAFFIDIVRFGSEDAIVQPDEMDRVRLMLRSPREVVPQMVLVRGQRVRVVRGCMEGLEGEFIRRATGSLLVLNLSGFGRSVQTQIEEDFIEPVKNASKTLQGASRASGIQAIGSLVRTAS